MVTLAGESAGAVYCHVHLITNAPVRQCILASGSLYLSPPQPAENVAALRDVISKQLRNLVSELDLHNASASQMIEAVKLSGIQSWFLEYEGYLEGWQTRDNSARNIMLSD
ncbi:hypothetical protein ACHAPI_012341, partial [Fusarium lateritium]